MVERVHHKPFTMKEIQAVRNPTTVLGNLLSHFPRSEFEKSVQDKGSDRRVRTLSSYDLLKDLIYGHVINAFSIREIESSLASHGARLYHSGMKPVKRTTLCDALERRDSGIFETAFNALVSKAQMLSANAGLRFRNPLKVIDASTIELCLSRFDWAKFRTTKGAVKLHLALNGDYCFPEQVRMTTGAVHEVNQMAELSKEPGNLYVFDRGYVDYKRLHNIQIADSFFVTRMKDNCQYDIVRPISFSAHGAVRLDMIVRLSSEQGRQNYPDDIRQVSYHDCKTERDYVFMTNDFTSTAQEIADIYKARWQVELFFKWIKQNLKIKSFLGTSHNAVLTQIWIAMCYFLLLAYVKFQTRYRFSFLHLARLFKETLMDRISLIHLLSLNPEKGLKCIREPSFQLSLF
jgi:Transposase DDE domain/Domain of unknown function (DUF4372)